MKNSIISLTILVLVLCLGVSAQKTEEFPASSESDAAFHNLRDDLAPVFVFTYLSAWDMVIGSDTPEFALYEDGTVIYVKYTIKDNPYSGVYLTAHLSSEEVSQIMKKINPDEFSSYNESYKPDFSVGVSSDLPKRLMVLRQPDGKYKFVSLLGGFRGKKYEKGFSVENVPQDLGDLIEFVTSFDTPGAKSWRAEYYEVMIEPSTDEDEKTVKWSKKLPGLSDPKTIKHKDFGTYSLFIPKTQNAELLKIWYKYGRRSSSESAVLINNRKWDLQIRTPFPSEKIWLGDFRN